MSSRGRVDHFITTDTLAVTGGAATNGTIAVTGSSATANRTIVSGTVNVYHELLKYTAAATFSNVVWGSATFCDPTTGTINATLTGFLTVSTSLVVNSGCKNATYTDRDRDSYDGSTRALQLII